MNNYHIIDRIGEGAHGIVLKATNISSGKFVALKKVPLRASIGQSDYQQEKSQTSIPISILREIKALQLLDHPNIVQLHEVFPSGTGFVLVFEYMESDLSQVLKRITKPLSESQTKAYLIMLLQGLAFCHENKIMHRDLKPANLLISSSRVLKLADFGLARCINQGEGARPYSHQVATRWYRAPELLYGAREYDYGVDLWAVGCIFGELLNNCPIFAGQNDIDQLYNVISTLGTPTKESWPQLESLPDYNKIQFPFAKGVPFQEKFPDSSDEAVAFLEKFLKYNTNERISAKDALLEPYFFNHPLPAHHLELPIPPENSKPLLEFDTNADFNLAHFFPSTLQASKQHVAPAAEDGFS